LGGRQYPKPAACVKVAAAGMPASPVASGKKASSAGDVGTGARAEDLIDGHFRLR